MGLTIFCRILSVPHNIVIHMNNVTINVNNNIGILEMIVLCFSVQGEDLIKHVYAKCYVFTF